MIKIIIVISYILFVAVCTVARPSFFSRNDFIDGFVGGDLLNILGVILTITLASIVHIHSEVTKIVERIYHDEPDKGKLRAVGIRSELNSSAWYLIGDFLAAIAILILKSEMSGNQFWKSALNGAGLGTLLLMVLIMYDIHRTIFALATSGPIVRKPKQSRS